MLMGVPNFFIFYSISDQLFKSKTVFRRVKDLYYLLNRTFYSWTRSSKLTLFANINTISALIWFTRNDIK